MKLEQAARQALEALEVSTDWDVGAKGKQLQSMKAITALREALAEQAEQEPVAWILTEVDGTMDFDCQPTIKPTQNDYDALREGETFTPLYAAPVRTKDLTDDEIEKIFKSYIGKQYDEFARAVIAADREKNK